MIPYGRIGQPRRGRAWRRSCRTSRLRPRDDPLRRRGMTLYPEFAVAASGRPPAPRASAWPRRRRERPTGSAGGRTSPSASGARCARTTRPTATAWDYFPHDHARSRAYRWGEDGLARDLRRPPAPLLRARALERARPDPQGAPVRPHRARGQPRRGRQGVLLLPRRHADPLLHEGALQVPAGARFPYARLVEENRRRGRDEPEFELLDTGVFDDDRYFDVVVEYAKAGPTTS